MIQLAKAGTCVRTFQRRASAFLLEPNPGYEAHILDRFPVLVRHGAARRADIRAHVNAQIRDCNKTTDVRTADSRTGIAPPSPLAWALLSCTPLALFLSTRLSRTSLPVPRFLPPRRAVLLPVADRISLRFPFPFRFFLLLSWQENGMSPRFL